jgi:hypothetical protein
VENNLGDTVAEKPWQRRHRSAVSNGNRLFAVEPLDGRTHAAMRFRDLNDDIIADLGGRDRLSTGQLSLSDVLPRSRSWRRPWRLTRLPAKLSTWISMASFATALAAACKG